MADRIFFFGGVDHQPKKFNTLYEYDPTLKEWNDLEGAGDVPTPRSFLRMAAKDNSILVFGGFDERKRNDLLVYSVKPSLSRKIRRRSELSARQLSVDADREAQSAPKVPADHAAQTVALQLLQAAQRPGPRALAQTQRREGFPHLQSLPQPRD